METTPAKTNKLTSALRIVAIIAIIGALLATIIASLSQKPSNRDKVWDEATTVGSLDASNYFIIYSDIACPYCVAFENAIVEHEDEFQNYIEQNDILLEVRLSDFLYEYGETNPRSSRYSAVAIYCAKEQGRFWDYYNRAITTVWNNYFKSGGKSAASELEQLDISYWEDLGTDLGLGDDFVSCVENGDPIAEIESNALKTAKLVNGMPYFKFNSYTSSGFDLSWGWEYVLMYFDSGLKS